ncbi:MAG: prepilin-type N-terminal cleavage/methylation domain-containing protein [Caulobacter sp.]|nr:prepilin-type N-terminal cleavage/methylation domain-containing protein [Caulobacter sp.]
MKNGFSLVELSIVLVILGLLTGGILAGQSLIRAAELRSVGTEYQRWQTGVNSFRDKYFGLPGDITNATRFWGRAVNAVHCVTNSAAAVDTARGVCDGDGDGLIELGSGGSASAELFAFWQQLANAGLIEGAYDGLSGASNGYTTTATNSPKSKLSSGVWVAFTWNGTITSVASIFDGDYREPYYYEMGGTIAGSTSETPLLKPEEMWNLDTKYDDGRPAYGIWRARYPLTCATAATTADLSAAYRLDSSALACVPLITGK